MFCSNCGNPLKENVKFCSNCGKETSITESTEKTSFSQRFKHNKKRFIVGIGALLIVAILFITLTGGGSPEDKVESLFEAIANEDVDPFAENIMDIWAWNMNQGLTYDLGENWSEDLSIETIEEFEDTAIIAFHTKGDSEEETLSKNDNGKWIIDVDSNFVVEGNDPRKLAEDIYEDIANENSKNVSKMVDLETRSVFQDELVDINNEFKETMGKDWIDDIRIETVEETDTRAVVEIEFDGEMEELDLVKGASGNWILQEDFYY